MSSHFAARLVVSITPADVGQRVSLRRRLPTGGYSDVVGILESWSRGAESSTSGDRGSERGGDPDGKLVVRRRDGERVEVAESTLAAGKVVPPPPELRGRKSAAGRDGTDRDGTGQEGASREEPPEGRR